MDDRKAKGKYGSKARLIFGLISDPKNQTNLKVAK
jgi:hypothetical protein